MSYKEHLERLQRQKRQRETPTGSLHQAALDLAASGFHVFPCAPGGKEPLIPKAEGGRGHLDATTDREQIDEWWRNTPDANVGISCAASDIVVLDIDPRNNGLAAFEELEQELGSIPSTVAVETGGEPTGYHYYFQHPGGSIKGKLGQGVDVKAKGYVVAPGSIHPSGRSYVWGQSPWQVEVAELPPAWRDKIVKGVSSQADQSWSIAIEPTATDETTPYGLKALTDEADKVAETPEGDRFGSTVFMISNRCGGRRPGGPRTTARS